MTQQPPKSDSPPSRLPGLTQAEEMALLMDGWGAEQAELTAAADAQAEPTAPVVHFDGGLTGNLGIIDAGGFWKFDKEGAAYCVHPLPLWPVEIVEAATMDGGVSTYVRVRFARVQGGVGEQTVALGDLGGFGRKDHPLVRAGWKPPTNRRASAVEEILTHAMTNLAADGKLPTRQGYETAGWVTHDTHVRPGMDLYVGPSTGSTATAGDPMLWAKTMTELMDDSGLCAFAVAVALGSLLRGVVPLPHATSHIFNLTGAPSRGKTTILRVVSALAGVPGKPSFVDGASTARGLENRLASANHGWLLVDEMDQLLMKDTDGGATTLMFISNGGGREKSNQHGGTVIGQTWTASVITTGNKSLLDLAAGAKKGEALATRIFEADILDGDLTTFAETSALPRRLHLLEENHGWGYQAAVEHIASNRGEWVQRFYEYDKELRADQRLAPIFSDQARLLAFFELALLGADLAGEVISEVAGARAHDAVQAAMKRYEQEPGAGVSQTLHRQHKLILDLHEWVSYNAGRFLWRGYAWKEPETTRDTRGTDYQVEPLSEDARQSGQARYLSASATNSARGALGQVRQVRVMAHETDFEGELVLGAAALDELERVAKIDRAELTTAAKTFGLLQTNEKDRDGYKLSTALRQQLGGGSRGLKLLLRKPDLGEQVRALRGSGAYKPPGWADDTGQTDMWAEQDAASLDALAGDDDLYIPGFDDEEDARREALAREEAGGVPPDIDELFTGGRP